MWDFTLVNFYCQILFKKKNKKYKKNLRFFLWEGGPQGRKQMHAARESFLSIFLGEGGPQGRKHTIYCVNHFLREKK